jgi:CheY-like chemotaxis protein
MNGELTRPPHVLVVDDYPDMRESLRILLGLWGFVVEGAADGPAALAAADHYWPDVVLLDLGLPRMDGYEVARRLRRATDPACPLLLALTGYAREEDAARALEAGCDRHLAKPIDPDELLAVLQEHARRLAQAPPATELASSTGPVVLAR